MPLILAAKLVGLFFTFERLKKKIYACAVKSSPHGRPALILAVFLPKKKAQKLIDSFLR